MLVRVKEKSCEEARDEIERAVLSILLSLVSCQASTRSQVSCSCARDSDPDPNACQHEGKEVW